MQCSWLNKQNNDSLIVFLAGWSFDNAPFEFLECRNFDVLVLFDYSSLDFPLDKKVFKLYKNKYLITWSMGVFSAYKLKDYFEDFDKKVAINGTVFPIDDDYGIPIRSFILTLRHSKQGLEGKFYQNIFYKSEEFEKYLKNPVLRTIENRVVELEKIYKIIQDSEKSYDRFYDFAYVSQDDKIIPSKNQKAFWTKYNVPYKILDSGHFPYYNFNGWDDIIKTN